MDRLLTQISWKFLSPTRSFSFFKPNPFDLKPRALLHLLRQSKSNTDFIYEHNPIFPLSGRIGFSHETKPIPFDNLDQEKAITTKEIRAYDCSSSLPADLRNLFLNSNILSQRLTAIIMVFQTRSDMSTCKNYWVDFIDPSNGKPYYGPATSDVLFETDERLRHFEIDTIDLGCCRAIEHFQYGTHVFVGCLFTSAAKLDVNVQYLLRELNYSS